MNRIAIALAAVSGLALAGCASKAPKELPTQAATIATPTPTPTPRATTPPVVVQQGVQAGSAADFQAQLRGRSTIFFDSDKFELDNSDVAALNAQVDWLKRYPGKRATIEGHCDERGTRDYNIALGERRANAAKNYLVSQGIGEGRLTTISYGKERPSAMGSSESAWAQNRRAVTITVD